MKRLGDKPIPAPVIHQFFPDHDLSSGTSTGRELLVSAVENILAIYDSAI